MNSEEKDDFHKCVLNAAIPRMIKCIEDVSHNITHGANCVIVRAECAYWNTWAYRLFLFSTRILSFTPANPATFKHCDRPKGESSISDGVY